MINVPDREMLRAVIRADRIAPSKARRNEALALLAAKADPAFGLRLADVQLHDQPYDYEKALAQAPPDYRSVVISRHHPWFIANRERLAEFAVRHKVARVVGFREWVANHVKAAKLVRMKAAISEGTERARRLQASNTLLICAALTCRAAGDSLDLSRFDRTAVCPDWSVIDAQIARFRLERVKAPSIAPSA